MKNNKKRVNRLISYNALRKILKKYGIKRIQKEAVLTLEKEVGKNVDNLINQLSQTIKIKGKKTLTKKDVDKAVKIEEEEEYPEI